jgi:hypothetical protein
MLDRQRYNYEKKIIILKSLHNDFIYSNFYIYMLGGSLVTTAWRAFRLRMEKTPSRYGTYLRIY